MSSKNLLVELFVEELPPKALKRLGEAFTQTLTDSLKAQDLAEDASVATAFASPRRLAAYITGVAARAADRPVSHKLMPVSVGLTAEGQPTPALLKRLAGMGLDASVVGQLKRAPDGKAEALFHDSIAPGVNLAEGLQRALDEALARLPIPKVMTYQLADGWTTVNFVRPAHGLVALHGTEVVAVSVLGLSSGRITQGHRFEAAHPTLSIRDADSYAQQMLEEGAVIASFAARRDEIVRQLQAVAAQVGGGVKAIEDEALLDEVTALVERPNVLLCQFEAAFLAVPQECLILTMKANQKYFPLLAADGRLTNQFLIVSNIRPADPSAVIGGNERVVRPRLADAKFFFDQDRKRSLADRIPGLAKVVYHNKLGTLGERVQRVAAIAKAIGEKLGGAQSGNALARQADQAAMLAKADLLTDMVGEFPELQGIMGRYYALNDGLAADVADAIEDHYKPRFAGDVLPRNPVGLAVALADKLETLVGLFCIGQVPTGDKDPFALRRHALGVIRMLIERDLALSLPGLVNAAYEAFPPGLLKDDARTDLNLFLVERLTGYLKDQGYTAMEVDAVVQGPRPEQWSDLPKRLAAVRAFTALPEAEALAAANKRIQNILRKAGEVPGSVDAARYTEAAERDLAQALHAITPSVEAALARLDYSEALKQLAGLRAAVDRFFDEVMVMAEDPAVRANRLALLAGLARLMNCVADISQLSTR